MINEVGRREGLFGDMGKVSMHDFSTANRSEEDRVNAVTTVASICFQNDKAIGSDSLYDKLKAESIGLPSSSFEFVPVLLEMTVMNEKFFKHRFNNCIKYGEFIDRFKEDKCVWLLTNLRALISDVGEEADKYLNDTEHEIAIIKKHFKLFKIRYRRKYSDIRRKT